MNYSNIAVIGSGISGLTTTYLLQQKYNVTLFEQQDYLGGHTNTVDIEAQGQVFPVNTGFIVFNDWTYPNFIRLRKARAAGIDTFSGDILSEAAEQRVELVSYATLIAATDNDAYNTLVTTDLAPEFGRENVFQVMREKSESSRHQLPRTLGGRPLGLEATHAELRDLIAQGWRFRSTRLSEEFTLEDWRAGFAINVDGPFLGCQKALRLLKDNQPGSIVNIITMSSHGGQPFLAGYAASKGALVALTEVRRSAASVCSTSMRYPAAQSGTTSRSPPCWTARRSEVPRHRTNHVVVTSASRGSTPSASSNSAGSTVRVSPTFGVPRTAGGALTVPAGRPNVTSVSGEGREA